MLPRPLSLLYSSGLPSGPLVGSVMPAVSNALAGICSGRREGPAGASLVGNSHCDTPVLI